MKKIDNLKDFEKWINSKNLEPAAIQSLGLSKFESQILNRKFENSIFLGCKLSNATSGYIVKTGGFVVPPNKAYSFEVHRKELYSVNELFKGFKLSDKDGYKTPMTTKSMMNM